MSPKLIRVGVWGAVGALVLVAPEATPQGGGKVQPKLEPVAETRLLMEGLAHPNFRGLERLLAEQPADVQTWTFARGQALLIAETGNLLLMRPPKSQGQPVWFERATDMRASALDLARTVANQDYAKSKASLVSLAGSCNRCHQAFRVKVEITAFADKDKGGLE
jgi:hypothetical protein